MTLQSAQENDDTEYQKARTPPHRVPQEDGEEKRDEA